MRLIDADPIMKFIQYGLNEKDPQKHIGYDGIRIMTEIEYAPTVQSAPIWTPCSDGLPEADSVETKICDCKCYLTTRVRLSGKIERAIMQFGERRDGKNGWFDVIRMEYFNGTVSAWQPLPEPYSPNKKEDQHVSI